MAREKFSTLTEQMFYILLCLREECCGMDVMARVNELTGGRVAVGPGDALQPARAVSGGGVHRRNARGGAAAQLSAHSGGRNAAAKRGGAPASTGAGLREAI